MRGGVSKQTHITAGLPESREGWPAAVLSAVEPFSMGDIVETPPLFYYADPAYAVWAATRNYTDTSTGPEIVDAADVAAPFGIITTQTCDIGEIGARRPAKPWITVSPVYNMVHLDKGQRKEITSGRAFLHLVHVPALSRSDSEYFVADLRLEVPVEKSWLVGRSPIKGFDSEEQQSAIGKRVGYIRGRPAWAEVVVETVQRTVLEILERTKKADKGLILRVMQQVDEIGARSDSMLLPTTLRLGFFLSDSADEDVREWCQSVADEVRDRCLREGLTVQDPYVTSLNECTVATHRMYEPVPLMRFSPM